MNLKKGLTTIELLSSIAILTLITTIAVPVYNKYVQSTRRKKAQINLGIEYGKTSALILEMDDPSDYGKYVLTGRREALPNGMLYYNIATQFGPPDSFENRALYLNGADAQCPCCDGSSSYPQGCCMMPRRGSTSQLSTALCSEPLLCFGGNVTDVSSKLSNIGVASRFNKNYNAVTDRKFQLWAWGCLNNSQMADSDLDVWMIDHRKMLIGKEKMM